MNIHILSSPLFRPNGIVEFIRAGLKPGDKVFCESKLTFDHGFEVVTLPQKIDYQVGTVTRTYPDGYVEKALDLPWSDEIVDAMVELLKQRTSDIKRANTVYTHCALSEAACRQLDVKTVFVQHESDVANNVRYSFLSDEWIARHKALLGRTTVGETMPLRVKHNYDTVETKYNFVPIPLKKTKKENKIIAIMDWTYRKGWDRYLKWWEENGKPLTTVMAAEAYEGWPKEWNVVRVDPLNREAKMQFIKNHGRAFIPSRSEVTCLALLECASQIETLVFKDPWTEPYEGASNITRI